MRTPRARRKNPETIAVEAIRDVLAWERDVACMRNNQGVARYEKAGRFYAVKYGLGAGSADLIVCGPGGRFVGLEVKRPGEALDPEQLDWQEKIRRLGGVAERVEGITDALAIMARIRRGDL